MQQHEFKQYAHNVIPMLSGVGGIGISISGQMAYTNGERINLPMGDYTDKNFLALCKGLMFHECGHHRYTSFDEWNHATGKTPALHSIVNSFEDPRIEKATIDYFPGAEFHFFKMTEVLMERGFWASPKEENIIDAFLLYYPSYQVVGYPMLQEYVAQAENIMRRTQGDQLTDALIHEMDKIGKASNTQDIIEIAKDVFELLKQQQEDNQQQPKPQQGQGDDAGEDEDGSQGQSQSDQSGSEDGPQGQSQSDQSGSEDGSQGQSQSDQSGDDVSQGQGDIEDTQPSVKSTPAQDGAKALEEFLNSQTVKDFHQDLMEEINQMAQKHQDSDQKGHGLDLSFDIIRRDYVSIPGYVPKDTSGLARDFYTTLHKVMFDQTRTMRVPKKTGAKIIPNRLSGIATGNYAVFQQRLRKRDITTAISVLVDASGSMGRHNMSEANKTAFALATAFGRMNVPSQVTYFGCWEDDRPGNFLHCAQSFGGALDKKRFGVSYNGSTPTHAGMHLAAMEMANRKEQNKFMFILTDGDPDSIASVQKMNGICQSLGIKIIPIGLGVKTVRGFDTGEFVCAEDSSAVNAALKEAIKYRLFN